MTRATRAYRSLPYNPRLKDHARTLRKAGNLAEVLLWNQLKRNQFHGLDFDRQKIIGNYIVDFYCAERATVIEIDGESHNTKADYDAQRDVYLRGLGLAVIHLLDSDVRRDLQAVMDHLAQFPSFGGVAAANESSGGFPSPGGVAGVAGQGGCFRTRDNEALRECLPPPRPSGTPPKEGNRSGEPQCPGRLKRDE